MNTDSKNSVSIEVIEKEATSMGNGIVNVIRDLQNLNSNVSTTSRGIQQLSEQFSSLGVSLEGSKLKDSFSKLNKDTLTYIDSGGNVVKVTKKLVDGNDKYETSIKKVNKEIQKSQSLWKTFTHGLTGALTKMQLSFIGARSFYNSVLNFTDSATKYEEALNLFTVTLGKNAKEASEWVDKFSKALYLDDSDLRQYMGSLNSLVKGLGVGSDNAYKMSKNLTQLVYDLSSFKNISVEESFKKIQSAMSGEIEPLRNVGVALSQNTLQELANSIGIKKRVAEMSEADKAQLRYIQIIKSTTEWQGDMARTLISPANAIRVLKQQFTLFGRALGRVFIPFVMKTIPYVMALTQVLTDLANTIANFFGYKITDIDYSNLKDVSIGIEDIGDAAEDTTEKLQTMLAPFDELNVVQNEKSKDNTKLSTIFDSDFDLPEYDALAGLTKEMDKQVSDAKEKLKEILGLVGLIGAGFLGWKIATSVTDFTNIWNDIAKKEVFTKKLGLTLALTGVALTAKGQLDIKDDYWKGIGEKLGGTITTAAGIYTYSHNFKLTLALIGVDLLIQSFLDKDNFWLSLLEALGGTAVIAGTTYKLTHSVSITLAVSGITLLTEGLAQLLDYKETEPIFQLGEDAKNSMEYVDKLATKYQELNDSIKDNLSLVDNHHDLFIELQNIVDENGKIKEGYEDRVKFIATELSQAYGIEIEIIDGQIQKYDELKDSIEKVIAKKKLEILLRNSEDKYAVALGNQEEATKNYNNALEKQQSIYKDLRNVEKQIGDTAQRRNELVAKGNNLTSSEKKELSDLKNRLKDLHKEYEKLDTDYKNAKIETDKYREAMDMNTKEIMNYENLLVASTSDSLDEINDAIDKSIGKTNKSMDQQLSDAIANRDSMVRTITEANGEITESDKKRANSQVETIIDTLKKQSQKVEELTPETITAWRTLAEKDRDAFEKEFGTLSPEVQNKIMGLPDDIKNILNKPFKDLGKTLGFTLGDSISESVTIDGSNFNYDLTTLAKGLSGVSIGFVNKLKELFPGKVKGYASGGFPKTGEFFLAREDGAEMVGSIGNRTAVANNDQITTSLTNALVEALSSMNFGGNGKNTTIVNIGGKKVYEGVGDYVDSENDRYGTNYIRV